MSENQTDSGAAAPQGRAPAGGRFLGVSIVLGALIIGGSLIYSTGLRATRGEGLAQVAGERGSSRTADALKNLPDDDVILGDSNAPVAFIEWGDYQCPFCGKLFLEVEPKLREEYIATGKVKMVYRDFAFLGPESVTAALAAGCAGEQGAYWAFHDRLFEIETADRRENNGNLTPELMRSLAGELGLDRTQFDSCLDERKYQSEIEKDYQDGIAAGVTGTPGNFINKKLFPGALPYETFKQAIDAELQKAAKK